jgi:subtilisin family serine protease
MKKITLFMTMMSLFISVGLVFGQETRTINQQEFIKEKNVWKLKDQVSKKLFNVSDEITIYYEKPPSKEEIDRLAKNYSLTLVRGNRLGFYDFKVGDFEKILTTYQSLSQDRSLNKVFVNTMGEYILTPNDPQFAQQWYLEQTSDADIDASDAWNITTGSNTITVAILDSGTDWEHEDLGLGTDTYQNIFLNSGEDAWTNPNNPSTGNGIDDDGNGFIDDWKGWDFGNGNNDSRGSNWHGTHVAGIVGAKTNNSTGIAGIAGGNNAQGSLLMIAGVGDSFPIGSILDDAILYASDNGADIIQLSLTVGSSPAIDAALQTAYNNGVFIVCASGNGSSPSNISYPSSNANVFSVGATNQTDTFAWLSNRGPDLDMSAPGVGIRSTQLNDTYANSDGTSFAAPTVSGTVALMRSVAPNMNNEAVENALKCTADEVGGYNYNWNPAEPGHSQQLGHGRLNTNDAVIAANTGDIFIKDTNADDGTEPSSGTMWLSPDIWVRHNDDGGLTHQNPEYKTTSPNWVYIRITRKNCSMVQDGVLNLYFSKASTGLSWPVHWINYFQTTTSGSILHGDFIGSIPVPLTPQEEVIVKLPWYPPDPDNFDNDIHHFCLLARIVSAQDPIGTEGSSVYSNTKNNNNIACKNVSVYDTNEFNNAPSVFIRNVDEADRQIHLRFELADNTTGLPFEEIGTFEIIPDERLGALLERANLEGIKRVSENAYQIENLDGGIFNIAATPFETYSAKLRITPFGQIKEGDSFMFNLVQMNEKFADVGGEGFLVGNFKEGNRSTVEPETIATTTPDRINIYPNPTSEEITIQLDTAYENLSVEIIDIYGNVILKRAEKNSSVIKINLKAPRGIYNVKVTTEKGEIITSRVLKQ